MDGAVNPYLGQAGLLAAGLDGIENKRDPGGPLHLNMYEEGDQAGDVKRLPETLIDALRRLERNTELKAGLGEELVQAYLKLKTQEWQSYTAHLSEWERQNTLDV